MRCAAAALVESAADPVSLMEGRPALPPLLLGSLRQRWPAASASTSPPTPQSTDHCFFLGSPSTTSVCFGSLICCPSTPFEWRLTDDGCATGEIPADLHQL